MIDAPGLRGPDNELSDTEERIETAILIRADEIEMERCVEAASDADRVTAYVYDDNDWPESAVAQAKREFSR